MLFLFKCICAFFYLGALIIMEALLIPLCFVARFLGLGRRKSVDFDDMETTVLPRGGAPCDETCGDEFDDENDTLVFVRGYKPGASDMQSASNDNKINR